MVGLATAWFLQERGVGVTVLESRHIAAGSSFGNAGWLTPGLTTPLPEPAVLSYGLRAIASPSSPVYLPLRVDLSLWRFLAGFVRHCTTRRWRSGLDSYRALNDRSLAAYDALRAGGVRASTKQAEPFLACFRTEADRHGLLEHLSAMHAAGQRVDFDLLDGEEARRLEPSLTEHVGAALRMRGQRYINPSEYLRALADSVRSRGGRIDEGVEVRDIHDTGNDVVVRAEDRDQRFAGVVIATGAGLNRLAGPFGVRRPVQAGRGYSVSIRGGRPPAGPVYLPVQRVACTPLGGQRLRLAGMMEFRRPDEPLDPRRVRAVIDAARPFLRGLDLEEPHDAWVGSRPCTPDGLPLIGPTSSPRVFAAGGHGMWGIILGPLTGQLLAEAIVTGQRPPELAAFDPLR